MSTSVPDAWRRRIAELVDSAPPLDSAQRDRLAVLLQPTVAPVKKAKTRRSKAA